MNSEHAPDNDVVVEQGYQESGIASVSMRTAVILLIFTLVFTAVMAGTYTATQPMLDASAQSAKLRLIGEVLAPDSYDNDLLTDRITLPPLDQLATETETHLYRARKNGTPVALVAEAAANDGYSGRITLLLAVKADGALAALRVTQHRETPGLGDYIDPKKDRNKRSPWIKQFQDKGFDAIPADRWRVKKDGGQFDQMTGATISARAVTNASRRALEWLTPRRDALFALPSAARYADAPPTEAKP